MAREHLKANNREIPDDLAIKMELQLCATLDPGWCSFDNPNRLRPNTNLTWDDVQNGLKVFSDWLAHGAQVVSPGEAERRALICSRCFLNVNVQGCSACQGAVATITKTLNRSTKYDFALRSCGACKCFLKAKVWFQNSTLDKENERLQEVYPSFCWRYHGGENYKPD